MDPFKRTKSKALNAFEYLANLSSDKPIPPEVLAEVGAIFQPERDDVLPASEELLKDEKYKYSALVEHTIKPVFGRYVTRNRSFADELITLRSLILHYAERTVVKRPLNLLIAAEPGVGKSFLIKELASTIPDKNNIKFDEYYTVALRSVSELTAIFHRIQSANLKNELPIILFDEVDGKIENDHVFAKFLAPMWDGVFHEGTETYPLGKAVLVFVASKLVPPPVINFVLTKRQSEQASIGYHTFATAWRKKAIMAVRKKKDHIQKCHDFIDRIDYMVCIPPSHKKLIGKEQSAQEDIDIICMMIKKYYNDVSLMEKSVLNVLLKEMENSGSRRSAEKMIFCSTVKDSHIFCFNNLPVHIQRIYRNKPYVKDYKHVLFEFKVNGLVVEE